jgi:uncharacterized membrane protein (DUF4010 family)
MTLWIALGVSVLIGTLVGIQRAAAQAQASVGLRDFLLTAILGWLCGITAQPYLTIMAVASLVAIGIARRMKSPPRGITTELAQLIVFGLAYVISQPGGEQHLPIAIAVAIAVTVVLGVKDPVKAFVGGYITEQEVSAAGQFLALIFIIYPLLPDQRLGPYGFFNPRSVWLFVILVSGVGFVGYFLRKYLGQRKGDWATGLVGGLISTTVTTSAFAADVRRDPTRVASVWAAATASNAVQFIRLTILVSIAAVDLVMSIIWPCLLAFGAGMLLALIVGYRHRNVAEPDVVQLESPLRIVPALQFAVYMSVIALISAVALNQFGGTAMLVTAALGSLVDVDAVTLSSVDLVHSQILDPGMLRIVVLVAVVTNMVVKIGVSLTGGTRSFTLRLCISFAVMLVAFLAGFLLPGISSPGNP